jgi:hypothetical protein
MNELKNLTSVVLEKLDKLVQKQSCSHDFFYLINYNIIIVQVTIEIKEVSRIGYNGFLVKIKVSLYMHQSHQGLSLGGAVNV